MLTEEELRTILYWYDNVDGGVIDEEFEKFSTIIKKLRPIIDVTEEKWNKLVRLYVEER